MLTNLLRLGLDKKQKGVLLLNNIILKPKKFSIKGHKIYSTPSCEQAQKLLMHKNFTLTGAVIEIFVPQGKWRGEILEEPGINFARYIRKEYGAEIPIVIYGPNLNRDKQTELLNSKVKYVPTEKGFSLFDFINSLWLN